MSNVVVVALVGLGGSTSTSGRINNHHSLTPLDSPHPVIMVSPVGSKTGTVSLVNRTL